MGWTLTIGEFQVEKNPDERSAYPVAEWPPGDKTEFAHAKDPPLSSAPGHENWICPGYIAWGDFMRRHPDLTRHSKMWADRKTWFELELLAEDVTALDASHLERFKAAQRKHTKDSGWSYASAKTLFDKLFAEHEIFYHEAWDAMNPHGWDALRLNWLVYWTEKAIEHLEYPTFQAG